MQHASHSLVTQNHYKQPPCLNYSETREDRQLYIGVSIRNNTGQGGCLTSIGFDVGYTTIPEITFRITYFDTSWFRAAELIQSRLNTVER